MAFFGFFKTAAEKAAERATQEASANHPEQLQLAKGKEVEIRVRKSVEKYKKRRPSLIVNVLPKNGQKYTIMVLDTAVPSPTGTAPVVQVSVHLSDTGGELSWYELHQKDQKMALSQIDAFCHAIDGIIESHVKKYDKVA